jgi:hypothetical protein
VWVRVRVRVWVRVQLRLLVALLAMGIYATGTINVWTAMFPQILLLSSKKLKKAARGASHWVMSLPGIIIVMWNDSAPNSKKKAVSFASTASTPGSNSKALRWVRRAPKPMEIEQPNVSKEYNANYGGIDRKNREAATYKNSRSTAKWWWAVFWHIMDSVIFNAWVLMYPDGAGGDPNKKHKAFCLALVDQLTGDYNGRKQNSRPSTEHATWRYDCFNHWL